MRPLELSEEIAVEAARLDREIRDHAFGVFGFSVTVHKGRVTRVIRQQEISVRPYEGTSDERPRE